VLVSLERRAPAPAPPVRDLVQAAFAHRRKALPRSLALATPEDRGIRDRARAALSAMDLPADARAERLTPGQFAELADRIRP
jgi:16S rRNA (adenine1518-N6/adenine1519-N6)-dimethyltransferase